MKWLGTTEDLVDIFKENRFVVEHPRSNRADMFEIGRTIFSHFSTGTLLVQGKNIPEMKEITKEILDGDNRFLD